jgi:hypothetical protein
MNNLKARFHLSASTGASRINAILVLKIVNYFSKNHFTIYFQRKFPLP